MPSLHDYAKQAADDVIKALSANPDQEHREAVTRAIQAVIVQAVLEAQQHHTNACHDVCNPEETDLAHKLADEMKRRSQALVANLESLR